jgi:hypothetical protein
MMFKGLKARLARAGKAAVVAAISRLVRDIDLPPDVTVESDEDGVKLSGRALRRRMLDDARLRKIRR